MVAAAALNTIPDNDQIVVAVRLVYQEWEDTKGLPGLLVVKATRQDGLTGSLQTGRTISDTHAPAHPGIPIRERNDKIGKILVDIGSSAQRDVLAAFSDQLGIPLVRVAGPRAGLSRNRGADGACPAPVACVAHGAGGFDAQAAMADTLDFETVGTVHAFSGLQIQTVLAAEPRRQPQTLPIYVGVCPRVPRLRSERASKFVKDQ